MTRALIVVRLSNLTDTTTSPERQLKVCREYIAAHEGWTEIGLAEDLDVSAWKRGPFERPALRRWLERPGDYDVILFWRADRLVRSARDHHDLINWADDNGVTLVSATEPTSTCPPRSAG